MITLAGLLLTIDKTSFLVVLGIASNSWNGAYPSAALNVTWMGIGAYVLRRSARSSKR